MATGTVSMGASSQADPAVGILLHGASGLQASRDAGGGRTERPRPPVSTRVRWAPMPRWRAGQRAGEVVVGAVASPRGCHRLAPGPPRAGEVDWFTHARRWTAIFLAVGVAWRLTRYGLAFPLWSDEAGLMLNVVQRHGYAELLGPLDHLQVAPLGFLAAQLTV